MLANAEHATAGKRSDIDSRKSNIARSTSRTVMEVRCTGRDLSSFAVNARAYRPQCARQFIAEGSQSKLL
jgi:hypothetical protein